MRPRVHPRLSLSLNVCVCVCVCMRVRVCVYSDSLLWTPAPRLSDTTTIPDEHALVYVDGRLKDVQLCVKRLGASPRRHHYYFLNDR